MVGDGLALPVEVRGQDEVPGPAEGSAELPDGALCVLRHHELGLEPTFGIDPELVLGEVADVPV